MLMPVPGSAVTLFPQVRRMSAARNQRLRGTQEVKILIADRRRSAGLWPWLVT